MTIYAPNTNAPIFIRERKTLLKLKAYIKSHTLILGVFNIPLLPTDRSSRQKLNGEIMKLRDILN
jgi:hypothetical protein